MKNADMPAMPQERDWQNDMEAHVATPNRRAVAPPTEGVGLTKREHFAGLAMQATRTVYPDSYPRECAARAVDDADALLAALESIES